MMQKVTTLHPKLIEYIKKREPTAKFLVAEKRQQLNNIDIEISDDNSNLENEIVSITDSIKKIVEEEQVMLATTMLLKKFDKDHTDTTEYDIEATTVFEDDEETTETFISSATPSITTTVFEDDEETTETFISSTTPSTTTTVFEDDEETTETF